jgi:NADPH:quinone reductase-like Zn-dependent oxidoreductase
VPVSDERIRRLGAQHLIDYHDPHWHEHTREATGGSGVAFAANAVPGGAGEAIRAVRDGGRLATITSDPPDETRGIAVSSVYVRPARLALRKLAQLLGAGGLEISVGSVFQIDDAAAAFAAVAHGHGGGAVVLAM